MDNYKIKVTELNPEFPIEGELKDGISVKGFFAVGFDEDGDPVFTCIKNISTIDLAQFIGSDRLEELTDAIYIAEGFRKAFEHNQKREGAKAKAAKSLLKVLMDMKEEMNDE